MAGCAADSVGICIGGVSSVLRSAEILAMSESQLSQADKDRIIVDIKLTLIIGILFTIVFVVLILIIPLILYFLGKTADGFAERSLIIISGLSLPFIAISWTNIIKYVDLRIGKKISFSTTDYKIDKTKDGFILETKSPLKAKFDLYDDMPALIKLTDPITIEIAKLSKTLLFISQANDNLLEKIEKEDK